MAESELHRRLKADVSRELQKDGYSIYHEPAYSPLPGVGWSAYRPDLFGQKDCSDGEDFVLVECETQPSMRKLAIKSSSRIWMQSHINHADRLRRILAIPPGTLKKLDTKIRWNWEIWIVDNEIFRIRHPLTDNSERHGGSSPVNTP